MRTAMDFTPFRRSLIGFDSLFDVMENASRFEAETFPPYDIEEQGEDAFRIRIAAAGFTADEIDVTAHNNLLTITGRKKPAEATRKFIHRGIPASGGFERQFQLAPHVKVIGANMTDGVLEVDLKLEVPEEAKPRRIAIGQGGRDTGDTTLLDNKKPEPQPQAA